MAIAIVLNDEGAGLYIYGNCDEDYCGIAITENEGAWKKIDTGLSEDQLKTVVGIDLNKYEFVLHLASGKLVVSNTHGQCGFESWQLIDSTTNFFSSFSLSKGYSGYMLAAESLYTCAKG